MSSAADKPSEYLKRTCLICGCNTNQTINIYEPRSGPNIVELIQAKFKFQPLNEDKYLCFSCNNWLINWHSLQANNSNDAESPSGTFRSSQVNGGIAQEKRAVNIPQQEQHIQRTTLPPQKCRPIAQVRPQQLLIATAAEASKNCHNQQQQQQQSQDNTLPIISKKYAKYYYAKRNCSSRCLYRLRKTCMKHLNACYVCGRPIVLCTRQGSTSNLKPIRKPKNNVKCRKCRKICQWRSIYMRSFKNFKPPKTTTRAAKELTSQSLVNKQFNFNNQHENQNQSSNKQQQQQQQTQCLKRPLVDGKVVAMLRRLGTTLSRECSPKYENVQQQQLPPIMSPAKPKPRWTRSLEPDEILLNFETAISEVLPIAANELEVVTATETTIKARRKLTYQMSCEVASKVEAKAPQVAVEYQNILKSLPSGLTVSLM